MDVVNEEKLRDVVVNPLLDRLEKEIIPQLQTVLKTEGAAVVEDLSTVLRNAIGDAETLLQDATQHIGALLAAQDGWTLEIGPITIPAITIRLTKPSTQLPLEPK